MKLLTVVIALALAAPAVLGAQNPVVSKGGLEIRFNDETRSLEIRDQESGVLLSEGVVRVLLPGRMVSSADATRRYRAVADADRGELAVEFRDGFILKARAGDSAEVDIRVEGKLEGPAFFDANAAAPRAMIAMLKDQQKDDQGVLVTTLGPGGIPAARSLFDPDRDLAMTFTTDTAAQWVRHGNRWTVRSEASAGEPLLALKVSRHYYRDELKIAHYAPITKRAGWQTAPVVAMTWYGIEGWKGKPAQTKEWLYPNIDWVARHLLPYAETLVFQLDDNYYTDNDQYMRDISDYIRSKGLIPGIWFTPYTVAPKEVAEKHPDWFIHDKDGKPIGTFGGVSYRDHYTLNVTNPDAVKDWFGMWWRKASETWNFDFFKIDGQPEVIAAYKKATDGGGVDGYRKGLAIGRDIVGPRKFINGCWGIPLDAIGMLDGSRTGPDTGNQAHAIDIVLKWNFLNNVAWWSDPDATANLYKATVERARLNAQARVLTGQQFLTDDVWTSVPEAIRRVWQLSYPMLNIKPVNLYPIDDWKKYDLFDLKIAKPWGTWDVVGLFNYEKHPAEKALDLGRLPLAGDQVHVFEYWSSIYLGKFNRDAKIPRFLAPHEGQLFSLTPVANEPVLISTSRHLSQGGLDLDMLSGRAAGEAGGSSVSSSKSTWTIMGKSSHLVAGDAYELVFVPGEYELGEVESASGLVATGVGGGVARATIVQKNSGPALWTVTFHRAGEPRFDVAPTVCHLAPNMKVEASSLGRSGLGWIIKASDARIHVSPSQGTLGKGPDASRITISADASGLQPGTTWEGTVTVETTETVKQTRWIHVRLHVPPPENLALRAKASASSYWGEDYKPGAVNDGDTATRWNSKRGETAGCWIELDWDKPVLFDRIVIDEVMEFGGRIEAWKLEAGDEKLDEIARGTAMGLNRTINLAKPVEAKRLRLTIEKAAETPTLREIEIYRTALER